MSRLPLAVAAALCAGGAFFLSTPAAAQACSVPGPNATQNVVLGEVLVFGEIKVRVAEADPGGGWIKIDVKIPGTETMLGISLADKQTMKLNYCGAEVSVTYERNMFLTVRNADQKRVFGNITFSAF